MKDFLATLAVILIVVGVAFYAAGWLKFQQGDKETTIEVKTGEIKRAADEAAETVVDRTKDFVGKVKEEMREEVREHTEETPVTTPAPSNDSSVNEEIEPSAELAEPAVP